MSFLPHYTLQRTQVLPGTPGEVFPFFGDAGNLESITPPFLRFRIVTPRPVGMGVGTLIEYRLQLHGLPIAWLTRIDVWEPGARFVDLQLRGPYALWHHTHEFLPHDGGRSTRMVDTVRYALPGGRLLAPVHALVVRRDLAAIFDYRAEALEREFGVPDAAAPAIAATA